MKFIKMLFIIGLLFILSGCTDEYGAKEVLKKQGYNNIQITGYDMFSCSKDDFFSTGFIAEKDGQKIEGTVCGGLLFKGSTIRFK